MPHGSCLGPILFLVYIKDLSKTVKVPLLSYMLVTVSSLCFKSKDLSWLNEALNEDLSHLYDRFISNKLFLNAAKTQSMLISTKSNWKTFDKPNQNLQVKIHGSRLEIVSKVKYLGIL